ncbi:MAG: gamma-glutamyltransferase family protein [Bauldia sp.]
MQKAKLALRGMVTSPHHLASEAGLSILRAGGNAVEATVAAAAALAVVYPHMTGLGGDAFWLVAEPGRPPVAIRGAGFSSAAAEPALFARAGLTTIPARGSLAATTVAGAVDSWREALALARGWGDPLPLPALLDDAIAFAEAGFPVSGHQIAVTEANLDVLAGQPGFADAFLAAGRPPALGTALRQPALAATLRRLAGDGLDGFYRGALADRIVADLARVGIPVSSDDLGSFRAARVEPLSAVLPGGARLWNVPPPSQGLASMIILSLFRRLVVKEADGFHHIHALVEATKRAEAVRARIADPERTAIHPTAHLDDSWLDAEARQINIERAAERSMPADAGDTVWIGAADGAGRTVSMIQSVFHGFGSGVVLPETGILWHNRGAAFVLDQESPRAIGPRRLPFHTLNPAMADFPDGRRLAYGSMGGDGQPQFQAAFFSRYAFFGQDLQDAVTAPRWVLGRDPATDKAVLFLESRVSASLLVRLRAAGHQVELVPAVSSMMGHAGAVVRHPGGLLEGASDPRSDGTAAGF